MVHYHVVFDEPRVENLLINRCVKHIFVHLTQEMVHLLVVSLEFVTLLHEHVLNTLAINGPVDEGYLSDG